MSKARANVAGVGRVDEAVRACVRACAAGSGAERQRHSARGPAPRAVEKKGACSGCCPCMHVHVLPSGLARDRSIIRQCNASGRPVYCWDSYLLPAPQLHAQLGLVPNENFFLVV